MTACWRGSAANRRRRIAISRFFSPYRVISDTYGVWVYDADAGFVRGYEPSLDFSFHGWRHGVMVIQHKDAISLAADLLEVDGPRKGTALTPLATIETDWGYRRRRRIRKDLQPRASHSPHEEQRCRRIV